MSFHNMNQIAEQEFQKEQSDGEAPNALLKASKSENENTRNKKHHRISSYSFNFCGTPQIKIDQNPKRYKVSRGAGIHSKSPVENQKSRNTFAVTTDSNDEYSYGNTKRRNINFGQRALSVGKTPTSRYFGGPKSSQSNDFLQHG